MRGNCCLCLCVGPEMDWQPVPCLSLLRQASALHKPEMNKWLTNLMERWKMKSQVRFTVAKSQFLSKLFQALMNSTTQWTPCWQHLKLRFGLLRTMTWLIIPCLSTSCQWGRQWMRWMRRCKKQTSAKIVVQSGPLQLTEDQYFHLQSFILGSICCCWYQLIFWDYSWAWLRHLAKLMPYSILSL